MLSELFSSTVTDILFLIDLLPRSLWTSS